MNAQNVAINSITHLILPFKFATISYIRMWASILWAKATPRNAKIEIANSDSSKNAGHG